MSMQPLMNPSDFASLIESHASTLHDMTALRHHLHQNPELTWEEHTTAHTIARQLRSLDGMHVKTNVGRLGVVGELESGRDGATIALRADMDALPIQESNTSLPYGSHHQGKMHACGHDGHMAILMATARILTTLKGRWRGKVRFIFQPAEEGGAGAKAMIEDGALEGVEAIFGLHGWPNVPLGHIAVGAGCVLAGNAKLEIIVKGKGGHGAMPHLCTDQVLAAATVVTQLQHIRSRNLAGTDDFVLSITQINGGHATNVVPDTVTLKGTMRFVSDEIFRTGVEGVRRVCQGVAACYGISIDASIVAGYPPCINHQHSAEIVKVAAQNALGMANVHDFATPSMGSEDFSYYLQKIPGAFFLLGLDDGRKGGIPSLHHPGFDFNDQSIPIGVSVFLNIILAQNGLTP